MAQVTANMVVTLVDNALNSVRSPNMSTRISIQMYTQMSVHMST